MTLINRAFAIALGLVALGVVATGILIGVIGYSPTPIWDMWDSIAPDQLSRGLFGAHNEHRIALSRLIFWTDILLVRDTGIVSTVFVYLFNAAHLVLLVLLARWTWPEAGLTRLAAAAAVAAVFFFSGFQYENFLSGFQNQFTGVFFFASVAIASLSLAASREDRWRQGLIAVSVAAALIASVSMANGLLIFPVLFVLALVFDLRATAWIVAVVGVAVWTIYLRGLSAGNSGLLSGALANPLGFLGDFFAYAGGAAPNSISALAGDWAHKVTVARLFGGAAVVAVGALAIASLRQPLASRPRIAAWAAIGLFVLGSGAITALGRSGFDDVAMLSSRYGAASAVLWAVLAIWLVMLARGVFQPVVLTLMLALALLLARAQIEWTNITQAYKYRRMDAEAALLAGVDAPAVYGAIYPDPARVAAIAGNLRQGSLAMFHEPWRRLYGQSLTGTAQSCDGEILSTTLLPAASEPSWRIAARAVIPSSARGLAVADHDGVVVGLLIRGTPGDIASDLLRFREGAKPLWAGYVRLPAEKTGALPVYAVDTKGRALCRLNASVDIDPTSMFRLVPARSVGEALEGVVASSDGVFPEGGHHDSAGAWPRGGRLWASWAGSDQNTGRINLKANVEGVDRLAIPVVTGPATVGSRLEVRADGVTLLRLTSLADMGRWSAIGVDVPPGALSLEIIAEDSSREWGGWIGVGEPHTVCDTDCPPLPCPQAITPGEISQMTPGGVVDTVEVEGETALLTGWAGDLFNLQASDHVVALSRGAVVACIPPSLPREDVSAAKQSPELALSGFALAVPASSLDGLQVLSRQSDGSFAPLQLPH